MSFRSSAQLLAVGLMLSAAPARAALLYNNGAPNGASGNEATESIQAEDFSLGAAVNLTSVTFFSFEDPQVGGYAGSVSWAFYGDGGGEPGALLSSGSTAAVTRTFLGTVTLGGITYSRFQNDFGVALGLGAGTYWLGLHNGPVTSFDPLEFYWETTDPNSTDSGHELPLWLGGGFAPNGQEHAFQIFGEQVVAGVPEPGTLVLLGGSLAALAGWRRFRGNARRMLVVLLGLGVAGLTSNAQAATPKYTPTVRMPTAMGVTPPLRELARHAVLGPATFRDEPRRVGYPAFVGRGTSTVQPGLPRVKTPASANLLEIAPSLPLQAGIGLNFFGIGVNTGYVPPGNPPDPNGEIGTTQYVQAVNTAYAVYDKVTGANLAGPIEVNVLFSGLPPTDICRIQNSGDPIVVFDQIANRWLITQFALDLVAPTNFSECVAVSQTADATGAFNVYSFNYGTDDFIDYPKIGVWPTGYFATYNVFNGAGTAFKYAKFCAFDRTAMLAGAPAAQVCFNTSDDFFGFLPSDLDGSTLPPAGTPNYIMGLQNFFVTENIAKIFKFTPNFTTPALSTLTGPVSFTVPTFSHRCATFGRTRCIPQPNGNTLEALSIRLMHRLAFRVIAGRETAVTNHAIEGGVRWYEFRNLNGAVPQVFQAATQGPDATSRFMGSVAMDKVGNMLLGYSASSSTVTPSLRVAGRLRSEPRNVLQDEVIMDPGGGSKDGSGRWGDYSAMTIDPVDDCTFWYTGMIYTATGVSNWANKIANFKFPNCQ